MLSFQDDSALSITGLAQVSLHVAQQGDFMDEAAAARRNVSVKLTCNGAAKQVSAGVAQCNMVGFVKRFELPL